jgi:HSP20 family molecular chaperone IbpA
LRAGGAFSKFALDYAVEIRRARVKASVILAKRFGKGDGQRATMKTILGLGGGSRVLSVAASIVVLTIGAVVAQDTPGEGGGFAEKMKEWQEKMSEAFRDSWQRLRQDRSDKNPDASTVTAASVDLREQRDSYTLRLHLPNRDLDKVQIELSGDTLRIVAPPEGKAARYEQSIQLDNLTTGTMPQVERQPKDNLIVVTIPKSSGQTATTTPPASPSVSRWDDWDHDVLEQMNRLREEMDRIFGQAFSEFRNRPEFKEFFDQAQFGSSFDLQEESDKYVVRAYLPDWDINNVNVSVEGDVLKLEAQGEDTRQEEGNGSFSSRKAQYSQVLSLPGPVQADKMTVERKENMLIVTLPKASAG